MKTSQKLWVAEICDPNLNSTAIYSESLSELEKEVEQAALKMGKVGEPISVSIYCGPSDGHAVIFGNYSVEPIIRWEEI